jgi:hypothetical protein
MVSYYHAVVQLYGVNRDSRLIVMSMAFVKISCIGDDVKTSAAFPRIQ